MFGLNDTLALGAMRVLQEAGLRVPEDVAVIGFDDLDEARYSLPSLTHRRSRAATRSPRPPCATLLQRIDDRGRSRSAPPREILARFSIAERESTPAL